MSDSLSLRRKRPSVTRRLAIKREENRLLSVGLRRLEPVRLRLKHGSEFLRAIRHLRTAKKQHERWGQAAGTTRLTRQLRPFRLQSPSGSGPADPNPSHQAG